MNTPLNTEASPRKRVAVLHRHFSAHAGGAERYVYALVEQLRQVDEIHVFAQEAGPIPEGVVFHAVPRVRKPRWVNQLLYATVTWWQTRKGFDVVHSHENAWNGQVQTVHVVPMLWNRFQGEHGWRWWWRALQLVLSPRLLAYAALEHARFRHPRSKAIVAVSQPLRDVLARHLNLAPAHIDVVTPGLDVPEPVHSGAARRVAARQALGLDTQATWLLWVGNDARKKGLPVALEALARLPEQVRLCVVGKAQPLDSWQTHIEKLGLRKRVVFAGVQAHMTQVYPVADVLVHPSEEDTFGMVVLEAMAQGVPVVVSRAPWVGISSELTHAHHALLLQNPRDADEIARCVEHALANADTLGQNGCVWARQHTWHDKAQAQQQIYERMMHTA